MRVHPSLVLAGALLTALHAACMAQIAPSASPTSSASSATAQQVEISSTSDAVSSSDSSAARTIVPRPELSKYGDSRLADALQRLPGVIVESSSGRSTIRVRGLGEGYAQVLVNGEPTRSDFSIDSIPLAMVDRVEIVRVGTVDMRAAGIGGTINILLRQTPRALRREVKASASSQRGRGSGVVDAFVGDAAGEWAYSLGAVAATIVNEQPYTYDQSFQTKQGVLLSSRHIDRFELNQTDSVTITPNVTWKPREGETLRLENLLRLQRYEGFATDDRIAPLGASPDLDRDRLDAQNETLAFSTRAVWSRSLGDGKKIDAKLNANRSRRRADSVLVGFDRPPAQAPVQVLTRRVHSMATDDGLLLSGSYRLPWRSGQISVGWDAEHTQRDEDRVQREVTAPDRTPQNLNEDYMARIRRVAVYLQDEWEPSDAMSLYMGARWEGMQTTSAGNEVQRATITSGVFSPVIESRWTLPSSQDKLRVSLGRSYKAPTAMELMARRWVVPDNSPTTPNFQGNAHLRPELSWGLDVSIEHPWAKAGAMTATAFAKRIDDVILRDVSSVDGVWIQQPVNHGRATVHGIEFDSRLDFSKLWPGAPAVDLKLNAMRAWSRVDAVPSPNNRLDRQRPYSAGIGLDYRWPRPDLSIGTHFGIVGGAWSRTSATVSAYAPPERRAEGYALWRIAPGLQVRLAVNRKTRGNRGFAEEDYFDTQGTFRQTTLEPAVTTWRFGMEWSL